MSFRVLILIAIVFSSIASRCCAHEPTSVVLMYEIDGRGPMNAGSEGTKVVAKAIAKRLGRMGEASATNDKQIRVELYGKIDEAGLKLAKQRINSGGVFEFRILADAEHPNDLPIIQQAKQTPQDKREVVIDDKIVAEWVPYMQKLFGPADHETIGVVKRQAGSDPEALVLIDDLNVTGEYLTSATKSAGPNGQPDVHFSLNRVGAEKLQQLTSDNLPEPSTPDAYRKIGIIFDKLLLTAPVLRSTISGRGTISGGSMTEREVDAMVDILNAGTLPCKTRLVDEKRLAEKK
jgi:preprotein translocase subunit SecD